MARDSLGGLDNYLTREPPDYGDDPLYWWLWCPDHGFKSLAVRGRPTRDMDKGCGAISYGPIGERHCSYQCDLVSTSSQDPSDAELYRELEAMGLWPLPDEDE